jgi:hypothetical protein
VLAELVCWINVHHRTAFRIGARYPDGEQGAYALVAGEGKASQSFVLKWQVGTELPAALTGVASLTERLRAVGYPAPRYRLVGLAADLGVVYSVQETLPGAPLGGRLDGGDGFCLLEPMRTHSIATSDLLTVVQRSAAACADELAPVGDVVHFDFQGGNILIENGHITGVVDWEGSRTGDCAFDLATLFFCADGWADAVDPAAALRLWRALQARTTPGLRRLYLAHMIHRQVDWAIRFLGPALVERNLRRADQVLRLLAAEEGTARP